MAIETFQRQEIKFLLNEVQYQALTEQLEQYMNPDPYCVGGKEQKIDITSSTGLSDEEIQKMQDDAKAHEEEDKKRKEGIEAKNNAEALIYQAEKTVKELGDKADAAKVKEVNDAIAALKESLKGDDTAKIKADAEALTKPLHELTEKLYQQAQQAQAQQHAGAQQGPQAGAKKADDNVVDADYKVVDDDKK